MFIGRESELKRINSTLQLDSFKAVLVYGRRRVGKTELINQAIRECKKPCLSLLARKTTSQINLTDFNSEASKFMNIIGFKAENYYDFFSSLFEYSKIHPFILFIDEYSFLKQGDDLIDSSLQKAIEFHSKDAKLTLILCGSYVDIMKRIVDIKAPLYGRFNEIILLKEFNYFDSSRFYPTLPTIDKIKYYATFGGTAFNILNMDYSVPFEENLITRFLENDSFFEKEAINVIASEIQKEENVNAILELIANGKTKFKELNDLLGDKSKDNISRYLAKLEEMDIIGKSYMVNDKFNKKPIYYIKNNLLDFYYSFVFKHQSTRQLMNPHLFYEKVVKEKFLKQYLPRKFEEIIKEYAIRKNSVELPLFFNAGRLIYNAKQRKEYINREFDLVLETDKGFIPIECKFFSRPLNENDINEEINQWKGLPFNIYKYGFASLNGFDEKLRENKDLILINSDDIYR